MKIPSTLWGVLIGSLFTIIGVIMANRGNLKALRIQHQHDRMQRDRERELLMKKEIYLEAMKALNERISEILRMGSTDYSTNINPHYQSGGDSAIGKIDIVADMETITAVHSLGAEITAAHMRISLKQIQIQQIKNDISILNMRIDAAMKDCNYLIDCMKEAVSAEITDEKRFNKLQEDYDFKQNKIQEFIGKKSEIEKEFLRTGLELVKASVHETTNITSLIAPVVHAMRAELELPFDYDSYNQIIKQIEKRQIESIGESLQDAEQILRSHI
jgi:hypothetical protein